MTGRSNEQWLKMSTLGTIQAAKCRDQYGRIIRVAIEVEGWHGT